MSDFLVRSSRNVIGYCVRLLASSTSDEERRRLERRIGEEEQFLHSLTGEPFPGRDAA
jgi:hypothetical protein